MFAIKVKNEEEVYLAGGGFPFVFPTVIAAKDFSKQIPNFQEYFEIIRCPDIVLQEVNLSIIRNTPVSSTN